MFFMVLMNRGKMDYLERMCAVQEEIVELEGKKQRVYEETKNINNANAIEVNMDGSEAFIGNLTGERVESIMKQALEQGYFDISSLGFKAVSELSEIGSEPYVQEKDYGYDC